LKVLEGGKNPAVARPYRFRTARVYRAAGFAIIGKVLPQEQVIGTDAVLRRYRTPPHRSMVAIYAPQYSRARTSVQRRNIRAAGSHATLVQRPRQPDFSTAACNSALIASQPLRALTAFD
jgi:hypothetical protein